MKRVREKVARFYLSRLATTGSPSRAMDATVKEYKYRRSTLYKWLADRRKARAKLLRTR